MEIAELDERIGRILEALACEDEVAQDAAFEQLMEEAARISGEEIAALIDGLEHSEAVVRQAASAAICSVEALIPPAADGLARALREDEDPIVRGNLAMALGRMGPAAELALEDLHRALGAEDNDWASASILQAIERIELRGAA